MPELPEIQALSERLTASLVGRRLLEARLLGFSSLKTVSPEPAELLGHTLTSVERRAKYLVLTFDNGLRIVLHLSQAGRLDLEEPPKVTRPKGAAARFAFDGEPRNRAILIREFGTHRKAAWWVLDADNDGPLLGLGPEPFTPEFAHLIRTSTSNRRLHSDLRDQHVMSGIGRGWGDDILHEARLSPFGALGSLSAVERERLIEAVDKVLSQALAGERTRKGGLSESSLSGRFAVHGRFGEPCPLPCGDTLARVSFESYEMTYCPRCQTKGKVLADRRMSRLLK
ncbi:MAG: DNA-formamidopyrimidine glycosylase family protein [Acidimicrobiales bacterium]